MYVKTTQLKVGLNMIKCKSEKVGKKTALNTGEDFLEKIKKVTEREDNGHS